MSSEIHDYLNAQIQDKTGSWTFLDHWCSKTQSRQELELSENWNCRECKQLILIADQTCGFCPACEQLVDLVENSNIGCSFSLGGNYNGFYLNCCNCGYSIALEVKFYVEGG